jgi:hypothetical protein
MWKTNAFWGCKTARKRGYWGINLAEIDRQIKQSKPTEHVQIYFEADNQSTAYTGIVIR